MEAEKLETKKHKKCSKRDRSSSSSSEYEVSRKKGHFKKSKISSKVDEFRAKKCSDVEGDIASKVERKRKSRKGKKQKSKSEESCSFSSSESEKQKKRKRKIKKRKKKKEKKHKKENAGRMDDLNSENQNNLIEDTSKEEQEDMNIEPGPSVKPANSDERPKRRAMAPMTKEEYDKQQSKVRRVFDPETGRERLVKGEGEIIEDIVSYERHREINKLSTAGDGVAFQKSLGLNRYDHDNKIYNRS